MKPTEREFLKAVAEVLDVPAIGLDDDFRTVEGWCSLQAFGLLILMENDFSSPVPIEKFATLRTVRDLWNQCVSS